MSSEPSTTGSHQTQHSNRIGWGWWLTAIVGLSVAVAVVAVALFASLHSGREIDPNQVMLALIALLSSLGAVIIPKLNSVGKNTSQTAEHVVNSHSSTILRDDIDDIDEIKRIVTATDRRIYGVEQTQTHQALDILGIRQEIGQIRQTERDQWEAIESTASRKRQNPNQA